jgi:uncharacterized protein (PEP-CTERM system associated)
MAAMASMASNRNNPSANRVALAGCLFALLVSAQSGAGNVKFNPTLTLNERYSDNIALTSNGQIDSFMTEVRPGFTLTSQGARGDISVDYGLQALMYSHDSDANSHNNQLAAKLNSNWLDERFFIEADARIAQQNANSTATLGTGNYNISNNRSETLSFGFAPSWRSRFGNDATLDARWRSTYVDSDSTSLPGTASNSINLGLTSGSAFKRVPWNLAYQIRSSDASSGNGNRNSSVSGGLGYVFSRKTRMNLTMGKDFNNGSTSGFNKVSGGFWNVGVDWAPTLRTHLGATVGNRYGGNSFGLDFSHRTRKSTWALKYTEAISDAYDQLNGEDVYLCDGPIQVSVPAGTLPDFGVCKNPQLIDPFLPGTSLARESTLTKNWTGSTSYKLGKSVFSLNLQKSQRKLLATAGNDPDDTYRLGGNWSLRLGPRLSSTLSLSSSHAETAASQSDDWSVAWLMSYQLTRQASSVLELRRVERDTDSTTGPFQENSVSARLNMSF